MNQAEANCQDEFFADMLPDFLDESDALLEKLNEHVLQLDEWVKQAADESTEHCDSVLLNDMFRAAHTLKGLSAMLGLEGINALTHKVENIFDAARGGQLRISSHVVDVTFQSIDRLHVMVRRLKEGQHHAVDCRQVLDQIHAILDECGLAAVPVADADEFENPHVEAVATLDSCARVSPIDPDLIHFADVKDDFDPSSKYVSIFIDESETTLDELTETLLAGVDENITEHALVLCHRMKGSAATLGLHRAAKLSHFMEDLLQTLNDGGKQPTVAMTDALLDCTDALRVHVQQLKLGKGETSSFDAAYEKLLRAVGMLPPATVVTPKAPQIAKPTTASLTDALRQQILAHAPEGLRSVIGQVTFRSCLAGVGLKARLAYERLALLGDIFFCSPPDSELDDLDELDSFSFGLATDTDIHEIRRRLCIDGIAQTILEDSSESVAESQPAKQRSAASKPTGSEAASPEPVSKTSNSPASPVVGTEESSGRNEEAGERPTETVRVDIDRLDQLMNLAGQLVINKARFGQIAVGLKQVATGRQNSHHITNIFNTLQRFESDLSAYDKAAGSHPRFDDLRAHARRIQASLEFVQRQVGQLDSVRASVTELAEAMHQLDRVSDGIQKCVMDTRMVPIGPLFGRFKRVIRDISRSNSKEIRLLIHGEKTELDKRMIDELGDPLIHIVRNSADHGIESPEVREACGKSREGTITLDASHRGNSIVIQIHDDGKGLDADKIRKKAVEKGILTQADADKLSDHQAYQLVWEPGLSTAEKVTEVSGRGMGMDIVRSKIEDISGTVELVSNPGVGTTITIKLPLTLAILPSLLAVIHGDVFAIPVESVVEIVCVPRSDLARVHGLETANVRGRVISVVQLDRLMEWNQPKRDLNDVPNKESDGTTTLVIMGSDGREIGLVVDQLLGEDDIVIKSLAENYRNVEGVAGASILGNGRVSLILDVSAIVDRASQAMTDELAV
jgi:two-component system chemotaxis sensor kinase CheA